jgi:hypothetical protein
MPSWKEILEQFALISAAPIPFLLVTIAIIGIVWFVVNWSYTAVLSSKSSQIELLERQVSDYKDKLNGATPYEAKARIDSLESRLARIEPRRLSVEQRNIIASYVTAPPGVNYMISAQSEMACGDCRQFLDDFQNILYNAHWYIEPISLSNATAASPKGIAILTPDTSHPLLEASALTSALVAAKIDFDLKTGSYPVRDQFGETTSVAAILITQKVAP